MADKRISQLIERVDIANNDVLPIVASGATTTNKVTISTIQDWMQDNLDVGVTSVGITIGTSGNDVNVTGSPITTSGNITINIPTATATIRGLLSPSDFSTFNNKLSSVGLSMPSAFVVSNSPLTANGTIAVTGAGTVSQYIRGDGTLADFPEAGGGGSSVSYYLNGSVSQGTIGGIAYREMNKTPIIGAGTDFVAIADGYLASFITDAGDPSLLEIPGGNWNFETYFSASSGGGTPTFYIELYKVSGSTATLIASNSATPELIAFGTTITPYFSTLAVPQTTLALTDRLALRYYVARSGRTITLHTENSHLCQIITTFTTGLTALNGLTAQVQNFATGTSGTDFGISSTGSTHTFNLPDASASNRGAVTTGTQTFAGVKTFNSTITAGAEVQLVQAGTALPTFIKNISGNGLTSSGSNGIGFNNSNNLYLSGSDKGGAVFSINNTGVRTYTFQNNNGTLAFTSDIPTNPVGGTGTTNQIPKFSATSTLTNSNILDNGTDVSINSRTSITDGSGNFVLFTPNDGTNTRIEGNANRPLLIATGGASLRFAAGGVTPQITLASTGAATFTGEVITNNGTNSTNGIKVISSLSSSLFTGGIEFIRTTVAAGSKIEPVRDAALGGVGLKFMTTANNAAESSGTYSTPLTLAPTGAATFSSSVTAGGDGYFSSTSGTNRVRSTNTGTSGFCASAFEMFAHNGTSVSYGGGIFHTNSTFSYQQVSANQTNLYGAAENGLRIAAANAPIVFANGSSDIDFSTPRLTISSTGAATFSSSVQGNRFFSVGSLNSTDGSFYIDHPSVQTWKIGITNSNTSTFSIGNDNGGAFANKIFNITNSGHVGIGTASPEELLDIRGANRDETSAQYNQVIYSTSTHGMNRGGSIGLGGTTNGTSSITAFGAIKGGKENDTAGNTAGVLSFLTRVNAGPITEKMRITSGGRVFINCTTTSYSEMLRVLSSTGYTITSSRTGTGSEGHMVFENANGAVGTIFTNGTSTSYNTSSDYRLKENVKPVENALSLLTQLKPCTFNFIADADEEVMGFIAHEVQEVFPQAISGEKDAVIIQQVEVSPAELDEEGNVITEAVIEEKEVPVYQGIDHSKLVPLLVAAIQEQQEQIKSLTEQVEALKSQING